MRDHLPDAIKHGLDALSIGVVVGTIIQILPPLAAALSIIYTGVRLWETETVKGWTGRLK